MACLYDESCHVITMLGTWTEVAHAVPWAARAWHCAIVYNDRLYVMGGSSLNNDIWSTDSILQGTGRRIYRDWLSAGSMHFYHDIYIYIHKYASLYIYISRDGRWWNGLDESILPYMNVMVYKTEIWNRWRHRVCLCHYRIIMDIINIYIYIYIYIYIIIKHTR